MQKGAHACMQVQQMKEKAACTVQDSYCSYLYLFCLKKIKKWWKIKIKKKVFHIIQNYSECKNNFPL